MLISHKYEVVSLLGKGSMGEVYKVRHVTLGAVSALKVLPSKLMDNPDLLARFYREARVMAKLIHPNIVRVIDIDHDDELKFHYFVLEFIQGRTLRDYLEEKKVLTLKETLSIARQIAQALQFAHTNDPPIIHRDIKPANIMLESNSQRAVLMDFGIAKELDEANMTKCEMMLGTVRYCPREQMLYEPLDGGADIYALGMVMYEAYTGEHFFSGLNENQVISSVLSDNENEPMFDASTPDEFKTLIAKSIAKSREHRYRQMSDFLVDLEACWALHVEKKSSKNLSELASENISDLDEHIQKLEHEKRRRLALTHKKKCQEAKGKAIQEGAELSAKDLFLEGCRQESSGNEHWHQEEYIFAQEAFSAAASLFSDAQLKASAIKLHDQTEQIKQQVQAVKTEADNYNAKEKARTFYGRALNFQSQAEELLEKSSYKEAYENFVEAFRIYQDARELAYFKSLKEDTEKLGAQAKQAHDEAVKLEAEELAPTLFKEAFTIEQQAESALSSEDLPQANELYRAAIANYSLARQKVMDQRKRLDTLKARKKALELWHRAKQAGAEQRFGEKFAEALQLKEQAQNWETQQNPEEAIEYYNKTASAFESLSNETELLNARDQSETIKQQLAKAKAKFKTLRTWAKEAWTEADTLTKQADAAWQSQQFLQAQKIYIKALEAYTQAQQQATGEQCNEQAQLVQTQLAESQQLADHCQAENYCQSNYKMALDAKIQGQESLDNRKYQYALEYFKKAREYFEQAVLERHQQLKQEINLAQQQAREYQAQDYASNLYHKGLVAVLEAEELWEQSCRDRSYDRYCEASRFFKEACELANRQKQKEQAEAVQDQAHETFDETVVFDPQDPHSSLFQQAVESEKLADAAFDKEDYLEAKNLYSAALEQCAIARHQELELVKSAQHQANESQWLAKQAGASADQDAYQQASQLYQSGEEYVEQKAYHQALLAFESAHTKYQQARREAGSKLDWGAFNKYKKTDQTLSRDSSDTRLQIPVDEEKTIVDRKVGKMDERVVPGFLDNKIHLAAVLIVLLVAIGIYFASSKKKTEELATQSGLTISGVTPVEEKLSLVAGQNQIFSVEVRGKQKEELDFKWLLDGNEQTQAEQWNYQPVYSGPENADKEIKVIISDHQGHRLEKIWKVKIAAPPLEDKVKTIAQTPPNHPPSITATEPTEQNITIRKWGSVIFSVQATDSDPNDQLTYLWTLDQKKVSTSIAWIYKARDEGTHTVTLTVADKGGLQDQRSWNITTNAPVKTQAPRIVNTNPPEQKIELLLGAEINFSVEVADTGPNDQLTYSWFLDGQQQSSSNSWLYKAQADGQHNVTLKVANKEESLAQRSWTVITNAPSAACIPLDENNDLCLPDSGKAGIDGQQTSVSGGNEPVENHAPRITKTSPAEHKIELRQGSRVNFSAEASDADPDDQLTYAWFLDGQKQSSSNSWLYQDQTEGQHNVTLNVADQSGARTQLTWLVSVSPVPSECSPSQASNGQCLPETDNAALEEVSPEQQTKNKAANASVENHPPEIVKADPADEEIELHKGDTINFSVEATDPDPKDRLTYSWTLDGKKQSRRKTWTYKAEAEGQHNITLTATDRKGLQAQQTWLVNTPAVSCINVDEDNELCMPVR